MKKLSLMLLLCLFVAGMMSGCGVANSFSDRYRRDTQIWDNQRRQLIDDWDYLILQDRNSRLSSYPVRIGDR